MKKESVDEGVGGGGREILHFQVQSWDMRWDNVLSQVRLDEVHPPPS